LYQAPLNAVLAVNNLTIPVMTVLTDISTLHRIWFNTDVDNFVVPNSYVKDLAISYGIDAQKILNLGIPVHPKIALLTQSKEQLRKELGWEAGKITILAVGSKRVEHFIEMLDILNHSGFQLQLVIVAGKDQDLFKELQENEWHQKALVYEFVDEMPKFLKAADIILCKAGGLIVTESLASGLPLLLIDVIPGQETGNAEFVVENKAGFWIKSQIELLSSLCHLFLEKNKQLKEMQASAFKLGKPQAAFSIAEKIYENVQKTKSLPPIYKERRSTILELLEKFQIRSE
jgi:1,2-diacylglycerol 3-beta-galactosyltransferase